MSCDLTHNFATVPILCLQDASAGLCFPPQRDFILFRGPHHDRIPPVGGLPMPQLPRPPALHFRAAVAEEMRRSGVVKLGESSS